MMRRAPSALLLAATLTTMLAAMPAHAQVTLGRLFSTPAERAAMESGRGASAALAPNSQGQQPAAGTPGGPPAPASVPVGAGQPGPPPGSNDGPGSKGSDGLGGGVAPSPGNVGGAAGPGGPGVSAGPGGAAAKPAGPPPPPPALVMSGVLRRSDNRTTVWLNDQPQYGVQKSLSPRDGAATPDVTVTLPSGKKVKLKPGQRYDLNEGRIKDVNEQ
jgi:hypothetical protein